MDELGFVTWASSEEGGGPDVGITVGLGPEHGHLWVGEITRQRYESSEAKEISDSDCGWWLIHYPAKNEEPVVLAKAIEAGYGVAREFFEELLAPLLRAAPAPAADVTAFDLLIDEFLKPQFMTMSSCNGKSSVEFTFHGEDRFQRACDLHHAFIKAAQEIRRAKEGTL
jgi:hypothetical protein